MAGLPGLGLRPKLKVLQGCEESRLAMVNQAGLAGMEKGRENCQAGQPFLRVLQLDWIFVGEVREFPVLQPKVAMVNKQASPAKANCPVYVLRKEAGKFLILDMDTGGQYEYRVLRGGLYIRRLKPREAKTM